MLKRFYETSHRVLGGKVFFWLSVVVLATSSCLVGYQGATLQAYNFDQLIDNYMFESFVSFSHAIFPAAHTFILKWPLFALGGALGNSQAVFTYMTIALQLLTTLGLLAIVYVATGRNRLVTAIMSCLISLLFLAIPIQEAPGTVAPIGVAMITTRNIEYILYMLAALFFLKSVRFTDKYAVFGGLIILSLALSDKLLLYIAIASFAMWAIHGFVSQRKFTFKYTAPIIYTLAAAVASSIIFKLINKFTTITINEASASISTKTQASVRDVFNASLDAIEAIVRNFGATVFDVQPSVTLAVGGVGFLISALTVWLCIKSIASREKEDNTYADLGRMLSISAIASVLLYVLVARTDGIAVRYLGMFPFVGIYLIALFLESFSSRKSEAARHVVVFFVVSILVCLPIVAVHSIKRADRSVEPTEKSLNISQMKRIANEMSANDVDLLVGIYYVVTLAKYQSVEDFSIVPLKDYGCKPLMTDYLTTKDWYKPERHVKSSAMYVVQGVKDGMVNGQCTQKEYLADIRDPKEVISLGRGASLYLYDFDIRSKLFTAR